MISAGDFRNGITFEYDGNVYRIVEFQHVKPGKGAAFVRTKMKNVISGGVLEKSFNPTEKFQEAHIEKKTMQYSYSDGDLYYFMDPETYDQLPLSADVLGDVLNYIREEDNVIISSFKGNIFAVDPAEIFVTLTVTQTDPGFRGDTATNVTKPATLETGYVLNVPLFIEEGDKVRVDTRTGEYMERA